MVPGRREERAGEQMAGHPVISLGADKTQSDLEAGDQMENIYYSDVSAWNRCLQLAQEWKSPSTQILAWIGNQEGVSSLFHLRGVKNSSAMYT